MHFTRPFIATSACLLFLRPAMAQENHNIVFPADAGVADVTKAPYNAVPNDEGDDTAAIQKALDERRHVVYLPKGTYVISDTLRWGQNQKRQILQGQGAAMTIIKLKDNCPGFGDAAAPKAMIWTGKAPAQRFRNGIRDLTVETGKGNPGAIGVQFIANNQGGMHDVVIRSGDGSGPIGLDLGYSNEQGPCLIHRVKVSGFDVGISLKHGVDSVTMEHVSVDKQNKFGVVNDGQCLSLRGLKCVNAVPAFVNRGGALATLIDSELNGGIAQNSAVINEAGLFARNLQTQGYARAIGGTKEVDGANVAEWTSHPVLSLFPSPLRSLNLSIKETPDLPWDDLKDWVSVTQFPPREIQVPRVKNGKPLLDKDGKPATRKEIDWSLSIQQAIDSGKSTVYFPSGGDYPAYGTVHVRGKVRRLIGLDSTMGKDPHCTFIVEDGDSPVVRFERFDWIYSKIKIQHASKRTLVVSSIGGGEYEAQAGHGDFFIEDVVGDFSIKGGNVWARQLNTEGGGANLPTTPRGEYAPGYDRILNDGGALWILGLKTEGDGTPLTAINGAKTEICGGFVYANKAYRPEKQWFINRDSALSFTLGEFVIRNAPFDPVYEVRGGQTKILKKGEAPGRGGGGMVVLYASH